MCKRSIGLFNGFDSVNTLLNPHLNSHWGQKSNFTLKDSILIMAVRSLIANHQSDFDIVTIKVSSHKPQLDHMIKSYRQIKF